MGSFLEACDQVLYRQFTEREKANCCLSGSGVCMFSVILSIFADLLTFFTKRKNYSHLGPSVTQLRAQLLWALSPTSPPPPPLQHPNPSPTYPTPPTPSPPPPLSHPSPTCSTTPPSLHHPLPPLPSEAPRKLRGL